MILFIPKKNVDWGGQSIYFILKCSLHRDTVNSVYFRPYTVQDGRMCIIL